MVIDFKKQGKANRARGKRFELLVRQDLERDLWIVDKWTNQVSFDKNPQGSLGPCKPKFNPFTKALMMNSSGLPDYIAFRPKGDGYEVIGVECKMGKYLSQEEKQKFIWLINNRIFSRILIASPGVVRGTVEYRDFE